MNTKIKDRHPRRLAAVSRLSLALAAGLALSACGGDDAASDQAALGTAPATAPAASEPAPTPETAVADSVNALGEDELRQAARAAYAENRLYAPAGDNAVEYYLALRDKSEGDASVSSALTDLLPMTVIATEQSIARDDFSEARRLAALLEKAEPSHPALSRLKSNIDARQQAAEERAEREVVTAEQQAAQQAELERQRLADQRRQQEEAAQQLAEQQAAEEEAARVAAANAAAAAEREAAERRAAQQQAARTTAAAQPTAADLRPLSTPAPTFPRDALRAGTSGEVQVEFTVGTNGAVTSARVVRSDPPRIFDRAALDAVQRWRFQPISAAVTTRRTIGFDPTR
ncbi:energy transducer TonB [Novilysobacter spongiicola]|uniref:Protein TonB n=1 Tax=Lysobacter spongiicola DSM 21749 TaxID=1122188 RepID=A0A1T4PZP8_9GAMM|nr:energy transducer TonB [Lysobacter spongiicola]SJZ96975.1 protein TonB [Lysobacter spongiicola DSM 21749]